MKTWYVYTNDRYDGPFSIKEVQSKLNEGAIHPDMHAWSYGMQDWEIMRNITDFSEFADLPSIHTSTDENPAGNPEALDDDSTPQLDPMDLLLGLGQEPQAPTIQPESVSDEAFELPKPFSRTHSIAYVPPDDNRAVKILSHVQENRKFYSQFALRGGIASVVLYTAFSILLGPHLPPLNNLSHQDELEVRAAVAEKIKTFGPTAGIGLVNKNRLAPEFYVGTNLSNGSKIDLQIDGLTDTLLDSLQISEHAKLSVKGGFTKSPPFQQENGTPFPRGEYQVTIIYQGKVITNKVYFLGGARDMNYDQNLKAFHEKLRNKAHGEIAEIKQFVDTLEEQLHSTSDEFQKLLENQHAQLVSLKPHWQSFHRQWTEFENQIELSAQTWPKHLDQKDFFYNSLYQAAIKIDQDVALVHESQTHYFDSNRDPNQEAQLANQISVVQSSLLAIKTKISYAESLPITSNGMPQRTGL